MKCKQCKHFFESGKNAYCGYYHEKSGVVIVPVSNGGKCKYFNKREEKKEVTT